MLEINNLQATINGESILKGLDLRIGAGEIHAIMGPNGAGKSTLGHVLAGREGYTVTDGAITFDGRNLLEMDTAERAHAGLFLGFQYPVEIPGVSNIQFLRAAYNAQRKARGEEELDAMAFLKHVRQHLDTVGMDKDMLHRGINEGFSGGEKKRNEILQMLVLAPRMIVLDETDSGLDIDALKTVAEGINTMRSPERSILLITHYQRLLDYVVPDQVHILSNGRISKSGGPELAHELEAKGYAGIESAA